MIFARSWMGQAMVKPVPAELVLGAMSAAIAAQAKLVSQIKLAPDTGAYSRDSLMQMRQHIADCRKQLEILDAIIERALIGGVSQ